MTNMLSALILHPNKPLGFSGTSCLEQLALSLRSLLLETHGYDFVQLTNKMYYGSYDLEALTARPNMSNSIVDVYISCFPAITNRFELEPHIALRNLLITLKEAGRIRHVFYWCNDLDYIGIPEGLLPKTYWQDKLIYAFDGKLDSLRNYQLPIESISEGCWYSDYEIACELDVNARLWKPYAINRHHLTSKYDAESIQSRQIDLAYVGNQRSAYRTFRLQHLLNVPNRKVVTMGIKLDFIDCAYVSLPKDSFFAGMALNKKSKATVVVGDKGYHILMPYSYRVLQSWAMGQLTFIDATLGRTADIFEDMLNIGLACMLVNEPKQIARVLDADSEEHTRILRAQTKLLKQICE